MDSTRFASGTRRDRPPFGRLRWIPSGWFRLIIRPGVGTSGVAAIALASDGVALERYSADATWSDLCRDVERYGPDRVLRRIHEAELTDTDGKL